MQIALRADYFLVRTFGPGLAVQLWPGPSLFSERMNQARGLVGRVLRSGIAGWWRPARWLRIALLWGRS